MNPNMAPNDFCNILGDSAGAAILKKSDVLVLDEIAMMNKVDLQS